MLRIAEPQSAQTFKWCVDSCSTRPVYDMNMKQMSMGPKLFYTLGAVCDSREFATVSDTYNTVNCGVVAFAQNAHPPAPLLTLIH